MRMAGLTSIGRAAILLLALCAACVAPRADRAADGYSEDTIKAAYLYRFAGYVKWPVPLPKGSAFTIDVLGDERVAAELARLLPGRTIDGRAAQVRAISRIAELGDAQMLYVGDQYTGDVRGAIASIASRPVLIVTDEERGLDDGGIINFIEVDRRVRFEVSLTAASRAGLTISSELLSVAARVQRNPLRSEAQCGRAILARGQDLHCPLRMAIR
jgi:hypothetical protein